MAPHMGVLIPRTVHRIWFGPHPMRRELIEYGRTWERHGYDLRLWTESNLPPLRNQRIYDEIGDGRRINVGGGDPNLGVWVQRADVVGYELVHQFGGIYTNTDLECLRDLDPILDGVTAFAAREDHHYLCNALMGATAGHPFFDALLDELPQRWDRMPGEPMNTVTGPHLLTHMRDIRDDLTVFPRELFFPFSFTEMDREWDEFPDAYTVHRWGHTRNRWTSEPHIAEDGSWWRAGEKVRDAEH